MDFCNLNFFFCDAAKAARAIPFTLNIYIYPLEDYYTDKTLFGVVSLACQENFPIIITNIKIIGYGCRCTNQEAAGDSSSCLAHFLVLYIIE